MRSFDRSNPAEEAQVLLLLRAKFIQVQVNAMMDRLNFRHLLAIPLKVANRDIVHFREKLVELAQAIHMRMMNGVHKAAIYKSSLRQPRHVIQVNDIAIESCIGD